MKSKCLSTLIAAVFLFSCFVVTAFAAGNPTSYKITLRSIDLKRSDGTWITVATPNQEIDIASVSQNAAAAAFNINIPAGDYVNFRLTLSETIKFSGSDGNNYTRAGGVLNIKGDDATDGSTATWAADPPPTNAVTETSETQTAVASQQGESSVVVDLTNGGDANDTMVLYGKTDLGTPITVRSDSKISMFFDFDTQNTVHYANAGPPANDIMYLTPPREGSEFGVTVDGVTYSITAANMRIDF